MELRPEFVPHAPHQKSRSTRGSRRLARSRFRRKDERRRGPDWPSREEPGRILDLRPHSKLKPLLPCRARNQPVAPEVVVVHVQKRKGHAILAGHIHDELARPAGLFERVYRSAEHHEQVYVALRPCLAPCLRAEDNKLLGAITVRRPEYRPGVGKGRSDGLCDMDGRIVHAQTLKKGDLSGKEVYPEVTCRWIYGAPGDEDSYQQVSRDENDEYRGITTERAQRILEAVGVRFRAEVEEPILGEESERDIVSTKWARKSKCSSQSDFVTTVPHAAGDQKADNCCRVKLVRWGQSPGGKASRGRAT